MITSLQAANIFIKQSLQNKTPLTHMQVQKLVYFLHGWWYAVYDEQIIKDDVEAWQHGPVYPKLYKKLKKYGDSEITSEISLDEQESFSDDKNLVPDIYDVFGKYEGWELSNMTHQEDTPWYKVYAHPFKNRIPEELIEEHFKNSYNQLTGQA